MDKESHAKITFYQAYVLIMSTIISYIKIGMIVSKMIQKVLTLKMYFPYFYLCPKFQPEIWRISHLGPEALCLKFLSWNMEKFIFQARNSCAPNLQAKIWKISYFHILQPKFKNRDFLGGQWLEILFLMQRTRVQFLVGELRYHMCQSNQASSPRKKKSLCSQNGELESKNLTVVILPCPGRSKSPVLDTLGDHCLSFCTCLAQ